MLTQIQDDLKAAAHGYRKRGWRVIQLHYLEHDGQDIACSCSKGWTCTSTAKHPINNGWQNTPPLSGPDIETLWCERPNANVGLAVGEASGFWVLDIDPKNGGMESMAALVAEHGPLPATYVVETGSGGYHYYFLLPEGVELRNSADRIGKGIDTRATGGQVVAAPSRSGVGGYTVVTDLPLAEAPAWLIEKARKAETVLPVVTAVDLPKPEDIEPGEWDRLNGYAKGVIEKELGRLDLLKQTGWDGEPWNHTTFHVACTLLEMANSTWNEYSVERAHSDLLARAPRDADFDTTVVEKCWLSATERIGANARAVPADRSSEPDPLFANPQVRQRPGPAEGGGEPGEPVAREVTPWDFFEGRDLLAAALAGEIIRRGPLGWGTDLDFWKYQDGVWVPDSYVIVNRAVEILGDRYRPGHAATARDIVRKHAQPITGSPLEPLMNFRNTMLEWRTGETLPHDPIYGSTVQLGTDWEADAVCPKFEEFLADVMHDDYIDLAWEMIGYLLMSGNPQHVAFLFYGSGGNGKSTLIDIMGRLVGLENIASESLDDLNGNRFRAASLFGKIANLAGDIDATYQENTATFKRLTGEDWLTAEHKGLKPFRFVSWAVNVFSANKFPGSADVTEGYFRRWIVLNFHKRIPAKKMIDRAVLMAQFDAELPGIAAKAVAALRVQQARGHFEPRGEAVQAKEDFMREIDQVRAWVASGDIINAPESRGMLIDLYASYSIWAERSGRSKVGEQEFTNRLDSIGFKREITDGGVTTHVGILTVPAADRRLTPSNIFN